MSINEGVLSLDYEQLNELFPFYFLIDEQGLIISCGNKYKATDSSSLGCHVSDLIAFKWPVLSQIDFQSILKLYNQLIVIELKKIPGTVLRGTFQTLDDEHKVLFVGNQCFLSSMQHDKEVGDDLGMLNPLVEILRACDDTQRTLYSSQSTIQSLEAEKNELAISAKSASDMALMVTQNPDPMFRIDMKGNVLIRNQAGEALSEFVYEDKKYSADVFWVHILSEMEIKWLPSSFEAISGMETYSFSIVPQESERYFNIYGKNITAEKKFESENSILTQIAQDNVNAVIIADKNGLIKWVNKGFTDMTGYSFDEVLGRKPGNFLQCPSTDINAVAYLRSQIYQGKPFTTELLNQRKDGKTYWVRITGQPYYNKKNELEGFFAIEENITQEKEREAEHQKTKLKLESILTEMTDVVWSVTYPDCQSIFISPSINHIFEISVDDWMQDPWVWKNLVHKDDRSLLDRILPTIEQRASCSIDFRIITPRGELKWINYKAKLIYNQQDIAIRMDGTLRDRTQRYLIEEQRAKESRLQSVLTSISSTYINIDLKLVSQTIRESLSELSEIVNAQHAFIFEFDMRKEVALLKHHWHATQWENDFFSMGWIPFQDISRLMEFYKQGKAFYATQNFKPLSQGEEKLKSLLTSIGMNSILTIPLIDNNQAVGFVGFTSSHPQLIYSEKEENLLFVYAQMIVNVRNRLNWEEQLTAQEGKYRNIIANMKLGLLDMDNQNRIMYANQTFCEMSGYSLDELKGKTIREILFSNQDGDPDKLHKLNLSNDLFAENEVRVISKKGEERCWFTSNAPNYNDHGDLVGSIGVHLDVTEQKILEHDLAMAKTVAEMAAKAKELFLANMSHEIRTPINALIGLIRQLERGDLSSEQRMYVQKAGSATRHLHTILNNILDMSKIKSGELVIVSKSFSLDGLVKDVQNILLAQAQEKGIEFKVTVDKQLHKVLVGDDIRIRQVLINLIGNAIKFTAKGFVHLNISVIETTGAEQVILFKIKDTGIGMSQEFVAKVFDQFSQEQTEANRKYEGTGLGMAISRDLVKMMGGGELDVSSVKNKGTSVRFTLTFPIGSEEEFVDMQINSDENSLSGYHILLAEDNPLNRLVVGKSLKFAGCTFATAHNGKEAVEKMKIESFDLILMDIQMPEMDGVEAARIIRLELKDNTPIIALTANAFKHDIDKYMEIGMNAYLTKPYDEKDLFKLIQEQVQNRKKRLQHPADMNTKEKAPKKNYDLKLLIDQSRGDNEFLKDVLQTFVDSAQDTASKIEDSFKANDINEIKRLAHKIKPAVSILRINAILEQVDELQHYDATDPDEVFAGNVNDVISVLRDTAQEIKIAEL